MNAWNGEIVAPVSRRRIALMYVTNAAPGAACVNIAPWYDGFGSANCGNLPDAAQSNLPLSIITPPIAVP